MRTIGDHAVVVGAGVAGLLAARVLADAYERVTVVERDPLPQTSGNRRGVPQGRHAHLLVSRGTQILDELFPGLVADMIAGGMPVVLDFAELHFAPIGHRLYLRGRTVAPFICLPSRPYLEGHLRARVRSLPRVEVIDRCEVTGLVTDPADDRVTGVRTLRTDNGAEEAVDANLVLDATGRGGRMLPWLASLGFEQPPEERLTIHMKYATRQLRLRPGAIGQKMVAIGAQPNRPTGLVLFAQEGDRWILTAMGYDGHHPPTEPDAFVAFVKAIVPPDLFVAIRDAEPLGDIVAYRFPAGLRRRYERLRRFPAGLLVFGDAICSSNPAYGLGMSVAALQAVALRGSLARGDRNLARRFLRAAAGPVNTVWQVTVGSDLVLPIVRGRRPVPVRAFNAYVSRVLTAAERDPAVAQRFLRVATLQDPPMRLFRPATALRVLLGIPWRRRQPTAGAPGAHAVPPPD